MVVLYEYPVIQADAMIMPAAAAHSIFLKQTIAGRGLACIYDASRQAGERFDILARQGGDSAKPLKEIKGRSLGNQNGAHGTTYKPNSFALSKAVPIPQKRLKMQSRLN